MNSDEPEQRDPTFQALANADYWITIRLSSPFRSVCLNGNVNPESLHTKQSITVKIVTDVQV
jgi:hypothetical protein